MRLIDADDLKKTWYKEHNIEPGESGAMFVGNNEVPKFIDRARTIKPVRHGRWIESTTDLICSACKTVFNDELAWMCRDYTYGNPRYCPYCGAKMDEEE